MRSGPVITQDGLEPERVVCQWVPSLRHYRVAAISTRNIVPAEIVRTEQLKLVSQVVQAVVHRVMMIGIVHVAHPACTLRTSRLIVTRSKSLHVAALL
jgi:hypothetical protein